MKNILLFTIMTVFFLAGCKKTETSAVIKTDSLRIDYVSAQTQNMDSLNNMDALNTQTAIVDYISGDEKTKLSAVFLMEQDSSYVVIRRKNQNDISLPMIQSSAKGGLYQRDSTIFNTLSDSAEWTFNGKTVKLGIQQVE